MKNRILIGVLLVSNAVTGIALLRVAWLKMMWQNEATNNAQFLASLWAANDYDKEKLVKLRLKVEDEPKGATCEPREFDGGFVVRNWIGYTDPFPILGGLESPSVQTARVIVEKYNLRMQEMHEHPDEYKKRRAEEIEYWRENVLKKKAKTETLR